MHALIYRKSKLVIFLRHAAESVVVPLRGEERDTHAKLLRASDCSKENKEQSNMGIHSFHFSGMLMN